MKKTLIAFTSALLLAGAAGSASAQNRYSNDPYWADSDRDGIVDRYDRYDNRYGRGDARYMRDRDCDGLPDRYDRNDRRNRKDRDCDGVPNRFDRIDNRTYQARTRYNGPRYIAPRGYNGYRYRVGARLPSGYWGQSYYIDYGPYGLSAPPPGYRWNRVGNNVYLVSTRDGLIAEVIYNLFR